MLYSPCLLLSIIFVNVCGILEWKPEFVQVFIVCLMLYQYCHWRSYVIKKERIGVPLTDFILTHFCDCPRPESQFLTPYAVVFFVFSDLSSFCCYWWNYWPIFFKSYLITLVPCFPNSSSWFLNSSQSLSENKINLDEASLPLTKSCILVWYLKNEVLLTEAKKKKAIK